MAQVFAIAHRGFEQRLLDIAWHITPNGDRRLAEQLCEGFLFRHEQASTVLTRLPRDGSICGTRSVRTVTALAMAEARHQASEISTPEAAATATDLRQMG